MTPVRHKTALRVALVLGVASLLAVLEVTRCYVRDAWGSHWSRVNDSNRDAWDLTSQIQTALDLRPGQRVVDIGAGSGYFTLRMARAVGPEGQVVATEVNPVSRWTVAWNAWKQGLPYVQTRSSSVDSVFPGSDFDRLLMLNVFPFDRCRPEHNKKLLRDVAKALREGGQAVIVHDALRKAGHPAHGECTDPTADELVPLLPEDLQVVERQDLSLEMPAHMVPGYMLVVQRRATESREAVGLPSAPTVLRAGSVASL